MEYISHNCLDSWSDSASGYCHAIGDIFRRFATLGNNYNCIHIGNYNPDYTR